MTNSILNLSFRDLSYIIELSQELHFSRASKKLHISQPALSAQIKKIENILGGSLFERDQKKVFLTDFGQKIIPLAQELLTKSLLLKQTPGRDLNTPFLGHLTLGVIHSLGASFYKHIILPFKNKFPDCTLEPREGLTHELYQQLSSGALDAIVVSPVKDPESLTLNKNFESQFLFYEKFFLAIPPGSPTNQKVFSHGDIDTENLLVLKEGHCLGDQVMDLCPKNRKGKIHKSQVTSVETLKLLVAAGPFQTLIPELWIKKEDTPLMGIQYLAPAQPRTGRELKLIWRQQNPKKADFNKLVELIKKEIPLGRVLNSK
jgi:LysR family hydrogen peroxide-inducible transcriptional activator